MSDSKSDELILYEGEILDPTEGKHVAFTRTSASYKRLAELAEEKVKQKWHFPTDALAQAWMLREFLRTGKHALVLSCERTRQADPGNPTSPVIVCAPDNCDRPCFNCTIAVLTGRKKWE